MAEARQRLRNLGALRNVGANKPVVPFIKNAEVRSYDPPMSDKLAYYLANKFGSGNRQSYRRAKKLTDVGQAISDYGTLPLYFTPYAPLAATFDIARGIVFDDPYEVALGGIGIARPIKKVAQTIPDEAEKALVAATGTAAGSMSAIDYLKSLFPAEEEEKSKK
jgi:hypothetical protein